MKTRYAVLSALLAISSTAWAQQFEDYARVRSATPEYERVNTPREECHSEYEPGPRHSAGRSYTGTVIGGVTGAIVGAQVGKGNGNKVATAAGAIAGAIIGDQMQHNAGYERYEAREVRRCRVVDQWESRLTGYRVTYEYAGRSYTTVLPEHPGRRLPVRVSVEPVAGEGYVRTQHGW